MLADGSDSSVRNWRKDGHVDGAKLAAEKQALRSTFEQILQSAENDPAIVQGGFYDLMYVNLDNPHFNSDRMYAFLRKQEQEVLLILANFSTAEANVQVRIPEDAFIYLNFTDNKAARITDLLTQKTQIGTLTSAWPFGVCVAAQSGVILRFDYLD